MAFKNINTWFHAVTEGREEAFHTAYEAAVQELSSGLGATHQNHVGGADLASTGGTFETTSPIDGRLVIGHFPDTQPAEVADAITAAKEAYKTWSLTSVEDRAAFVDRVADAMTKRFYELCAALTLESGKTRFEASIDVDEGIDFCRSYAAQYRKADGYEQVMGVPFPGEHCVSRFRPYGVFGVIAPFNFPVAIAMGMTVGAVLTGNTVVFKPGETGPLCGQLVFQCLKDAGLPAGVVNLVHGDGKAGKALANDKRVDGFVFTGSKPVGLSILANANADRARPVVAEMGGKNPIIVTKNADLDAAAEGVFNAAFGFTGQKCSACSRLFVHEDVKDTLLEKVLARVKDVVIGDPRDRGTFLGPVIEQETVDRYLKASAAGKADGKILCGGEKVEEGDLAHGHFVRPTIVDGLPHDHELFFKELFCPFVAVATFTDLDEVIARANEVEYGLTAGIFSKDQSEIERFFNTIEAGVIYANRRRGGSTGAVVDGQSFVGWKNSGTTGRGAGGRHYLLQFLREQSVTRVTE